MTPRYGYALRLLLAILVWAPIPLGSNRPWAWALLAALIFALVALLALDGWRRPWLVRERPRRPDPPLVFALLFLLFVLLQALPLPGPWVAWISPAAHAAYAALSPLGIDPVTSLSLDRGATLDRLLVWASALAVFLLARGLVDSRERLQLFASVLTYAAAANVLYGLANYLSVGEWGFFQPAAWWEEGPSGTYVNRNHFSGLLEMILPLAMARTVVAFRTPRGLEPTAADHRSRTLHLWATLILVAGLAMAGSRMGALLLIVLLVAGYVAFLRPYVHRRLLKRSLLLGLGLLSAGVLGMALGGGLGRLLEVGAGGNRLSIWQGALEAWRSYWLVGSGGGTFRWVFPPFKPAILDPLIYDHAHNDYLEFLVEYGAIGGLLLLGFLASALWIGARRLRRVAHRHDRMLGTALLLGLSAMLVHELVDFNLTLPANLVVFAALLGVSGGRALRPSGRHRRGAARPAADAAWDDPLRGGRDGPGEPQP